MILLPYYTFIFFQALLIVVITTAVLLSYNKGKNDPKVGKSEMFIGYALVVFVILYMGLRPISGKYFGDMATYAEWFGYARDKGAIPQTDILFDWFLVAAAKIFTPQQFFILCSFSYVFPLYIVSKRLFGADWYYSFLILICSFSFWAYGTNGVRNGIATSFFLLAFASKKKTFSWLWILISVGFHKAMLLPGFAYFLTLNLRKTSYYLYFWLFCIPVSYFWGAVLLGWISELDLGIADKLSFYFGSGGKEFEDEFSRTGFRWDFLLYTAIGIAWGAYFILKKNFKDRLYVQLFNIYVFVSGVWILLIYATFTNRIAYLAWFLLGLIIIYPLLKNKRFHVLPYILLVYFGLTYILNVILS